MAARDNLIAATVELLWERGYGAVSPAMIQERAGAGQGSMYHHFAGKADLAAAAARELAAGLTRDSEAALATGTTAVERITAFLDLERLPLRGCRLGRLVQEPDVLASPALYEVIQAFFAWLHQRLLEVLAAGREAGELRPDTDDAQIAALVLAAVQGGYVLARALQDESLYRNAVAAAKRTVGELSADPS